MFFKREKPADYVTAGAEFRRTRPDHMVETARVISIGADGFGIPHVKYELCVEKPLTRQRLVEGVRVLALGAFADTYHERLAG